MESELLAFTEFLVVDTETNGLAGEACELTEIGAVLVGGGELHDRFQSLVRCHAPLRRGIQRFTGITQEMVDRAPEFESLAPELDARLVGRVMVAHNAAFDRRVLRQAFERVGRTWPDPPVLCTAALARAMLPLQRVRRLRAVAEALGIDVEIAHRALADAETCARILCALFPKLCANATTVGEALEILRPRRPRRPQRDRHSNRTSAMPEHAPVLPRVDFSDLPRDPGVYLFRDQRGEALYVGKSISIRSRARAHFAPSGGAGDWTAHAVIVDYRSTNSELGALVLENRLIKQLRPPGNVRLTRADDRLVYIRCRLDIPFPILEVSRQPAAGHAVTIGPVRGRTLAQELVEQLDSLFGLRHCGRRLPRRQDPSAYGQMGRCLSPCLGDLDPNLYRRRLDEALGMFVSGPAARRLVAHVEMQMREAAAARRYERATWLRRRARRLEVILARLGGLLEAMHARPRLLMAFHPADRGRADLFWLIDGRLVDWGPVPRSTTELVRRTEAVLGPRRRPELGAHLPPNEVDEARIIGTYLASHDEVTELPLDPAPPPEALARFAGLAKGQTEDFGCLSSFAHGDG